MAKNMQLTDGTVIQTGNPEIWSEAKPLPAKAGKELYREQAREKLRKLFPEIRAEWERGCAVIRVVHIWRGIFSAQRTPRGKKHGQRELYRRIEGVWHSGEAFPQGCRSSPLRAAAPDIAAALDQAAARLET